MLPTGTEPLTLALLFVVAGIASAINAVAGGGSLFSFPALLAVGLPPVSANVTNSVGLWPGYAGGSLNYRRELSTQGRHLRQLALPSALGALAGAWILLHTPEKVFAALVPALILAACGVMAAQDHLAAWVGRHHAADESTGAASVLLWAATFLLGVYGAYFGAALGIMLLAVLGVLLPDDIQQSNALKGLLSLVINAVAVLWFALFGPVVWLAALTMAIGSVLGGWLGVGVARRLGRTWLRRAVVGYGVFVAGVLVVQGVWR